MRLTIYIPNKIRRDQLYCLNNDSIVQFLQFIFKVQQTLYAYLIKKIEYDEA